MRGLRPYGLSTSGALFVKDEFDAFLEYGVLAHGYPWEGSGINPIYIR